MREDAHGQELGTSWHIEYCKVCAAYFYFNLDRNIMTDYEFVVGEYLVCFTISLHNITNNFEVYNFSTHKSIVEFNFFPDINPTNFLQKLSTLKVFS